MSTSGVRSGLTLHVMLPRSDGVMVERIVTSVWYYVSISISFNWPFNFEVMSK